MAQLAIKGHATRGKEVIDILKMLGGSNPHTYSADCDSLCFYVCKDTNIIYYDWVNNWYEDEDTFIFTLEEFLEVFPYRVGDKVQHKGATSCGTVYVIERMKWANNHTEYEIRPLYDYNHTGLVTLCVESLQPYKEETMEEKSVTINSVCSISKCKTTGQGTYAIKIADGYKFDSIDENGNIIVKPIKPQRPKTYEECCKVLNISYPYFKTEEDGVSASTYKNKLFGALKQLIICRDAYWKIAGDWKFDFDKESFYLCNEYGEIQKFKGIVDCNVILAFPTEEMRDAFAESKDFQVLMDLCKEFL